jgi:hypothetical protein
MEINYQDIGLIKNHLYEVLATTFTVIDSEIIPNTSCMGVRLTDDKIIQMTPYPLTKTLKNLRENGFAILNFVDNIYLYALASLKDPDPLIDLKEFPYEFYNYHKMVYKKKFEQIFKELSDNKQLLIPHIKNAWAFALCKTIEDKQIIKKHSLGELKIIEFKLKTYSIVKTRESFKLFNRAENLTLEILILATRLKIAKKRNDKYLYDKIYGKIIDYMKVIERFSKNQGVKKSLQLVSKYLNTMNY